VTATAALAASLIASCSSSGGGSSDKPDGTASNAGLTKSPYVVEVITELSSVNPATEAYQGAQAAAAAVNADGGINGHPLQVKVCDAGGSTDVAKATACARSLVADKSILAEVGDFQIFADQSNEILKAANVANIGASPNAQSILSSKNAFPLQGSEGAALGIGLADAGAKTIQVAYTNVAQAAAALQFSQLTVGKARPQAKVTGGIPINLTATDLSPQVAKGKSSEGVALAMLPAQLSAWLTAAKSSNATQKLGASASSLLPSELKALGSKADGVIVVSGLPLVTSSMPGVVRFRDEMKKYQPNAALDGITLNGWLSTWAFAQVARTIQGEPTRASVLDAFSNLTDFNVFGLLPEGFSTTKEFDFPGLGRLFNQYAVEGVVKDGQLVQTSEGYVPVFAPPA